MRLGPGPVGARDLGAVQQVSDIIDWRVNQWDREWIEMVFHRFDTKAILKIPLSRRQVQDAVVWLHCKNGKYLVKSDTI